VGHTRDTRGLTMATARQLQFICNLFEIYIKGAHSHSHSHSDSD